MRHIVMRLPEEAKAEFIYMVPFTPRGKDNLAAWMVARNDGAEYGKLRVYRLSRQSLVFGPQQIENRINQDTEISRQLSLWDQRGSTVIRGDLLVIPIEKSLHVRAADLPAGGGRADSGAQAGGGGVSEPGGDAGDAGGRRSPSCSAARPGRARSPRRTSALAAAPTDSGFRALVAEASKRYEAALQAQRDIDWARYGEEFKRLGEVLEQLRAGEAAPRR